MLTIRLAEVIGLEAYEALTDHSFYPEWFFSQHLFGDGGSKEIENSWESLKANPETQIFRDGVLKCVDRSEEAVRRIALEIVPRFIDDCARSIDWSRYGAVGFTTTFAQSFSSALLAKRIKDAHPNVSIIFGGANVDGEMGVEFLKTFEWVDHVVHGEGEVAFPELLRSLATSRRQKIAGVSSRTGSEVLRGDQDHPAFVDLNQAPVPDYSDYVDAIEKADFRSRVPMTLFFESSRGCWWGAKHHCTFCGLNATGMTYRKKDARRVYDEIIEITASTKCLNLFATDNIFPLDYFQELLPQLAEADIDVNMFYEVKANLSRAQVKLLADAGVRAIQPGIESFTTKLLSLMQKGITGIQNIQFLKWCRELDVHAAYNILFGFPGESAEDYETYPQLFRTIEHLEPPIMIGPVIFERFSPFHFDQKRFGLDLEATPAYSYLFPRKRVDVDRIAYYFQDRTGKTPPVTYMGSALEAYEEWKKHWRQVTFFYNKGPGYLILNDNRRLDDEERQSATQVRRTVVEEPAASIYLFCVQHRSLTAICKMVHDKFGTRHSDAMVEAILRGFVKRRLMYQEDNKYLALAIRSRRLSPTDIPS